MAQVLLDSTKFEKLFISIEKNLIMQSSFLESMYNIQSRQIDLDKEREETRRREALKALSQREDAVQPAAISAAPRIIEKDEKPESILSKILKFVLGGASFLTVGNVVSTGLAIALAGPIKDFISGAVSTVLENSGLGSEFAKGLGDALGQGAAWANIGRMFGAKAALIFGLAGVGAELGESLFKDKVFELFDQNEDGIISAFGAELDAQDFGNFGMIIGGAMGALIPSLGASVVRSTMGLINSYLLSPAGRLLFSAGGIAANAIGSAFTTAVSAAGIGSLGLGLIIAGGIVGAGIIAWNAYKDTAEFIKMIEDGVAEVAKDPIKMAATAETVGIVAQPQGVTPSIDDANAGLTSYVSVAQAANAAVANLIKENALTLDNVSEFFRNLEPEQFAEAVASSTTNILDQKMLALQTMTPEIVAELADASMLGEKMTAESNAQIRAYLDFMLSRAQEGDFSARINYEALVDILRERGEEVSPEELIASGEEGYALFGKLIQDYVSIANTLSKPEVDILNTRSDNALMNRINVIAATKSMTMGPTGGPGIIASGGTTNVRQGDTNTASTYVFNGIRPDAALGGQSLLTLQYALGGR